MILRAALVLAASPALAEPFVLLIHEAPDQIALRTDPGAAGMAYWAAYADWGRQAAAAGVMRGGAALVPVPVSLQSWYWGKPGTATQAVALAA